MMHPIALVLPFCLQNLGDTVVMSPISPMNMNGAIDSSMETLGPLFVDHPDTIGQGQFNTNTLAETTEMELNGAPEFNTSFHLAVRATIIAVAASYGLTDHLDASVVIPIIQEEAEARATVGPFGGHTTFAAAGLSDLGVRLKYQFHPNLAATLEGEFPTGDADRGLGTGNYWLRPGLAASVSVSDRVQVNADVTADVNLSFANRSGVSYGLGASALVGPVALVAEFLGSVGNEKPLTLFGVDYNHTPSFDLAFGIRAPLPYRFVVFAAGTYALNRNGLRPSGVSPVLGLGWNLP